MSHKPYLVGIVGGSGSGKTSFLRDLVTRMPNRTYSVVSQDNYYRALHEQERDTNGQPNFDLPTAFHREHLHGDLCALLRGEAVTRTEYTFNHRQKQGGTVIVEPAAVLLIEGLFLYHDEEIRDLFNLRVFIDAPEGVCKERRMRRDAHERGYLPANVEYKWTRHVQPAYRQFILPYRDKAHIIVDNQVSYNAGLEVVAEHLQKVMLRA
jgi:uridine kinase